MLSKPRRNEGPKQTRLLVTHLPKTPVARQIVGVSLCRWAIALLHRERKGVVGLGQHQVSGKAERIERSVAVAPVAYLLLRKVQARDIPADRPWSAFGTGGGCLGGDAGAERAPAADSPTGALEGQGRVIP
ncbi:MAG: hypothetical protein KatS3mg131_2366 [Candidatus Tectimicrobiota bacterium]|nr:MAG: hypothetical protein KatS3mg131_2366 [Candidatus Tectomicrobia bacterium]